MDMLDAEIPSGDEYDPQQSPESDGAPDEEAVHDAEDGDGDDAGEDAAPQEGHQVLPDSTTESDDDGAQAPRRSTRKPAPKVTWWESNPKAYVAAGPFGDAKSAWDLSKPPTNACTLRLAAMEGGREVRVPGAQEAWYLVQDQEQQQAQGRQDSERVQHQARFGRQRDEVQGAPGRARLQPSARARF